MNPVQSAVLRHCLPYLLDNLYDVSELLDHLFASSTLSAATRDDIADQPTPRWRKVALLDALARQGSGPPPGPYQALLDALASTGCGFIVDELKRVEQEVRTGTAPNTDDVTLSSELADTSCQRVLTQPEMARVARQLSPRHIPTIALLLGVSRARLDQYEAADPHDPVTQIQRLLCDWLMSEGRHATVGKFARIMKDAEVDEDVYLNALIQSDESPTNRIARWV